MPLPDDIAFVTPRLQVLPVQAAHLPDLLAFNGDDEVTRFLPYATWTGEADAQAWLARMGTLAQGGTARQLVLVLRETGRAIGTLLLFRHDEGSRRLELGYVLGRAHWGRGLMHEALAAACEHAFVSLGCRRLEAEVNPANIASCRLLERLGFLGEGCLRERWTGQGRSYDTRLYGLLATDPRAQPLAVSARPALPAMPAMPEPVPAQASAPASAPRPLPMRTLRAPGLVLEPLVVAHAAELYALLADPALYTYLDYGPPGDVARVAWTYQQLEARQSPDGREQWLNWAVRALDEPAADAAGPDAAGTDAAGTDAAGAADGGAARPDGPLVGTVQATVLADGTAWVGYVFGRPYWGRGYARRAVAAMIEAVRDDWGTRQLRATVEQEHLRSIRLLEALGFRRATDDEAAGHELTATERLYIAGLAPA